MIKIWYALHRLSALALLEFNPRGEFWERFWLAMESTRSLSRLYSWRSDWSISRLAWLEGNFFSNFWNILILVCFTSGILTSYKIGIFWKFGVFFFIEIELAFDWDSRSASSNSNVLRKNFAFRVLKILSKNFLNKILLKNHMILARSESEFQTNFTLIIRISTEFFIEKVNKIIQFKQMSSKLGIQTISREQYRKRSTADAPPRRLC